MARRVGRILPAVFITGGNPDAVVDTAPSTTTVGTAYDLTGQLGALYQSQDGTREWIYVQFSATATGKATAKNQVLYWMSSTTTTLSPTWVVDNQTSANTGISANDVAGILRTTSTSLGGKYIWAMRRGLSVGVVSTSTKQVKGDVVVATTASGEASVVLSTSTDLTATVGGVGISWMGGNTKLGIVNSTSTAFVSGGTTAGLGVNIDTILDIT